MILRIPSGFTIFGFEIRFYGIIMAVAMAIGVFVACKNAKFRNLKSDNILILACYVLPLAVIGARVFSFFSERELYSSFWEIFNLRTGGMSIFGGIIGGALAILLYCLIHKKNFFDVADVVVPSLILGQAIGRWGNFFNQEVYGLEVTNKSLQWFPFSVFIDDTQTWHLATFFYEFVLNLLIFVLLMLMLRKFKLKKRGIITATYLLCYGTIRAFLEPLRVEKFILSPGGVRISLLTSIICAVLGFLYFVYILIMFILEKKKLKPKLAEETPLIVDAKTNPSKSSTKTTQSEDKTPKTSNKTFHSENKAAKSNAKAKQSKIKTSKSSPKKDGSVKKIPKNSNKK